MSWVFALDSLVYWYQNRLLRANVVAVLGVAAEAGMYCCFCWATLLRLSEESPLELKYTGAAVNTGVAVEINWLYCYRSMLERRKKQLKKREQNTFTAVTQRSSLERWGN